MPEEPENHTIRLLQMMRTEMQEMRTEMRGMRDEMQEMRDDISLLNTKVDGNTLILNVLAGVLYNHEERIETLEKTTLS